jgi:hypothetical protein
MAEPARKSAALMLNRFVEERLREAASLLSEAWPFPAGQASYGNP